MRVIGRVWTFRDISRQKVVEDALRESRARYSYIIKSITDYIYTVEIKNEIAINTVHAATSIKITGYSSKEYIENPDLWYQMIYSEDKVQVLEFVNNIIKLQLSDPFEHRIIHKDGSIKWIRQQPVLYRNPNGELIKYDGIVSDITERKEAELELYQQKKDVDALNEALITSHEEILAQYNALQNNLSILKSSSDVSADGILITSLDDKVINYNKKFNELFSLKEKDLSLSSSSLFNKIMKKLKNPDKFQIRLNELLEKPDLESWDILESKDGRIIERYSIPHYHDNMIIGRVWSIRDVTDKIKNELKIQESEKEYREIVENALNAIIKMDTNGNIIFINSYAENLFEFSSKEIIGKHISDTIIPKTDSIGEDYVKMIENIIEDTENYEYMENENITKSGKSLWMVWKNKPIMNSEGKLAGILCMGMDNTEKREAQKELKRLAIAVQQSANSIIITDLEGSIQFVNPEFLRVTGYTLNEVIGANTNIIRSFRHDDAFYSELWKTIKKGKVWKGEFVNKKKNGEYFWERAVISPVKNRKGNVYNYVAVKEDITEKKDFDRRMMKVISETEDHERERFARDLHDGLGATLSSIKMYLDLLELDGSQAN